jgi:Mrp family chromosome partitioning ATPase
MAAWIERLRGDYDFIVLDTPPILSVSDALVLSHLADTTLYLVRWGESARPVVAAGLRSFRANGGGLAGAVLTRVNMAKHSGYSYGDDKYAHGKYYEPHEKTPS